MRIGYAATLVGIVPLAAEVQARCEKPPGYLTEEYLQRWEIIAYGMVTEVHDNTADAKESFSVLSLDLS